MKYIAMLLAMLACAGGAAAAPRTLHFCFDEHPPYVLAAKAGKAPTGIKVAIAATVFSQLDMQIDVRILPFARCLAMVESGQMDGALPLSMSAEREKFMAFSQPVNTQVTVFVYKKSRFPNGVAWKTYDDIKHLNLAMNRGSIIDQAMEAAFGSVRPIARAIDAETLIKLVDAERVDLVALDKAVATYLVQAAGLAGVLETSEQTISETSAYFGISRKSELVRLLPEINRVLDELHRSGVLARLVSARY
ncbi:MAG: transporter substrate-binding domain-containing protein [Pseudomonadota bacterium]